MECPYCENELRWIDYFGFYLGNDKWDKKGDIYKCDNESCESEIFNYHFHTYINNDNLKEGYPC